MNEKELRKSELLRMGNEAALMRELNNSPMWDMVVKHLTAQREEFIDRMIRGTKEGFEYRKGFIEGLEMALGTPKQLVDLYEFNLQGR